MTASSERDLEEARPRRPILIEVAGAILIIGSAIDTVIAYEHLSEAATSEARLLAGVSVAVGCGLIALGLLIRRGRAWLLALNVVAVAAFLELQSLSSGGVFAAALDMVVVGALLRERWWFQWTPEPRSDRPDGARGGERA